MIDLTTRLIVTLVLTLIISGCTPLPITPTIRHFTNPSLHYSFSYPNTLKIFSPLSSSTAEVPDSGFDDERDSYLLLSDAENKNKTYATILTDNSPQLLEFASDQEAVQNYIDYWTSSTSQYMYPEGNQVRGPISSEVTSKSGMKKLKFEYSVTFIDDLTDTSPQTQKYDIYILSHGGKSAGTGTLMPYSFLVIKYLQEDQQKIQTILDTFAFTD